MIDTQKNFYGGVNYHTKNFTISQVEPKLYQDEYGSSDDDMAIQFEYNTKILNFGDQTINKCLWMLRTYLSINELGELYQEIYADGALVDRKLIDNNTIIPVDGIGTEAVGTFAIGTE